MIRNVLSALFGTSRHKAAAPKIRHGGEWVEGGLYAVPRENGAYSVLKLLKHDAHGVHVRCYSNVHATRPASVDESTLYMAGVDKRDDEPLGMGHLPISHASFTGWGAIFIQASTVSSEELEGYEMWREAEGGYF